MSPVAIPQERTEPMVAPAITYKRVHHSEASENDRQLKQLEQLSTWLDSSISFPGTTFRIGWDTLIGLIPGVGDVATSLLSGWIVWQARQMGVSKWILARMIAHVGIDTCFGAVPFVGDVFDATYKANRKNVALLRRHLKKQSENRRSSNRVALDVPSVRSAVSSP